MHKLASLDLSDSMAGDVQNLQMLAACMAIGGCCALVASWRLPLQRQDVTAFLAPLPLLLGSGAAVLAWQLWPGQLMQALCARILPGLQPPAAHKVLNAQMQLERVADLLCGTYSALTAQEAAAATAAAAGPPQRVLRWLLAISQALLELPSEEPCINKAGQYGCCAVCSGRVARCCNSDVRNMKQQALQLAADTAYLWCRIFSSHVCQLCRGAAPPLCRA